MDETSQHQGCVVHVDQADTGLPALIADHFVDMGPATEKS